MSTTRDQIIQTTCELLELQGYYATGLNQIIKDSGSPKGSLYYHFPGGKEELAAEAVRRVGQIVLERIQTNLAAVDDTAEAIRAFILNIAVNVERSNFQMGGPITTIAMETAATSELLRETCHDVYTEWQNAFAERLIAGDFAPDRARRLSVLIIAAIEGGVILSRTERSSAPLEQVAAEIGLLLENA
ncbi:MAG: TetR/AcrR family transcriptional regulator [Anaerolineales bacterium]